jgi:hypothetical protein
METAAFQCSMDVMRVQQLVQQMSADANTLRSSLEKQEKERLSALDGERKALGRIEKLESELNTLKQTLAANERKLQEESRGCKLLEVLQCSGGQ